MSNGPIIACFPVEMPDQVMLATSKGQSIRIPVDGISFRSRSAGGVRVFNTGKNEEVVSVAWIADRGDEDEDQDDTQTENQAENQAENQTEAQDPSTPDQD